MSVSIAITAIGLLTVIFALTAALIRTAHDKACVESERDELRQQESSWIQCEKCGLPVHAYGYRKYGLWNCKCGATVYMDSAKKCNPLDMVVRLREQLAAATEKVDAARRILDSVTACQPKGE